MSRSNIRCGEIGPSGPELPAGVIRVATHRPCQRAIASAALCAMATMLVSPAAVADEGDDASAVSKLEEIVVTSLKKASLFEEVKDRLHDPGTGLSRGQQQRLCIARAIAVSPEVILMDEPCSALDPIATARIEELMDELKENYTIIIVTHSMQQAARVSQQTAFFHLGLLVETGETQEIFTNPRDKRTQDYITGRFG